MKSETTSNNKTKEFFDTYADHTNAGKFKDSLSNNCEVNKLDKFLNLPKGAHIAELGAGVGRCAVPLLSKGYKITGIDISKDSLEALRRRANTQGVSSQLDTLESDFACNTPEEAFDGAYCVSTIHLLSEKEEGRAKIFKNLVNSVKSGGSVVVLQPNPLNPLFYFFYFFSGFVSWSIEKNFLHYKLLNLKMLFLRCGLKDIRYEYYGFLPTRMINKFPLVYNINAILCRIPLLRHLGAFIFIRGTKV